LAFCLPLRLTVFTLRPSLSPDLRGRLQVDPYGLKFLARELRLRAVPAPFFFYSRYSQLFFFVSYSLATPRIFRHAPFPLVAPFARPRSPHVVLTPRLALYPIAPTSDPLVLATFPASIPGVSGIEDLLFFFLVLPSLLFTAFGRNSLSHADECPLRQEWAPGRESLLRNSPPLGEKISSSYSSDLLVLSSKPSATRRPPFASVGA